ncbi:unnamed protein product [Cuscuta campestris]|uniref:Uncharacterized protein n=1 Tax=Cuscuta campestris TaxID=132261 RepID=A0A484LTH1_9ASTE|nr:unnamed protein product [Cuscuta campestris]
MILFRGSESQPHLTYGQKSRYKDLDAPTNAGSSPLLAPFPLNGTGVGASHRIYQVQDLERTRSPPSLQVDEEILWNSRTATTGRSLSSSPSLEANQLRERNFAMPLAQSKIPAVSTYLETYKSWEKMPTKPTNQVSKRSMSPPNLLANGGNSVYGVHSSKRPPSSSPPKLRQNFPSNALGSHTQQQSLTSVHNNADGVYELSCFLKDQITICTHI